MEQGLIIPVNLYEQLIPGTYEYTLNDLIDNKIEKVFCEVLLVCNELKMIRKKMFTIDGCQLPSNASKEYSGTRKELQDL